MNTQRVRLANTQHMLVSQRGGAVRALEYKIGERLSLVHGCDLSVDEGMISVPAGAVAVVKENNGINVTLDLGRELGGRYTLPKQEVTKYFERAGTKKTESLEEANPNVPVQGRRVRVSSYDANLGPNRGPKSPGFGGYESLVGQQGEVQSLFGEIKGVKTYRVNLVSGGQFIFGETELDFLGESVEKKEIDYVALRGLGFGTL